MKTIRISPTKKASQRTKNRIREHGPVFEVVGTDDTLGGEQLLARSGKWLGWLPRSEFSVEHEPRAKARVNKDGFMGSASREHRVKKGKGSFRRHPKHREE